MDIGSVVEREFERSVRERSRAYAFPTTEASYAPTITNSMGYAASQSSTASFGAQSYLKAAQTEGSYRPARFTASIDSIAAGQTLTANAAPVSYSNPSFGISYLVSDAQKQEEKNAKLYNPNQVQVTPANTQTAALGAPNTWSRYAPQTETLVKYADRYDRYQAPKREGGEKFAPSTMDRLLSGMVRIVSEHYQRVTTWTHTQMGEMYDAVSQIFPQANGLSYAQQKAEQKQFLEKGPIPITQGMSPAGTQYLAGTAAIRDLKKTVTTFFKGTTRIQLSFLNINAKK
ncbi:MAG: hypothetical protein Q7S65_02830 [Nanoarchaeota archaeon]|nr:hypothetical protein [Nanoarchaeota archaeon]